MLQKSFVHLRARVEKRRRFVLKLRNYFLIKKTLKRWKRAVKVVERMRRLTQVLHRIQMRHCLQSLQKQRNFVLKVTQ